MNHLPLTSILMLGSVGLAGAQGVFQNPVLNRDLPDPFVMKVDNGFLLWATNGPGGNVQTASSPDLVHWTAQADAMPYLAPWVVGGHTWAPEVIQAGDRYLLFYTARDRASGRQAIGVAEAKTPQGPFVDTSGRPLVCQVELGGSIDANPVRDSDGQLYLLWKNDGNAVGFATGIFITPISETGRISPAEPTELITNDALWEGNLVEAPTMVVRDGWYYLLYSASDYGSDLYGVGVAVGRSVRGPFEKSEKNPLVASKGSVAGPGHQYLYACAADKIFRRKTQAKGVLFFKGSEKVLLKQPEQNNRTSLRSRTLPLSRPAFRVRSVAWIR